MSFVWRGLCFKNEKEANSYENYPSIPVEDILMTFEKDMRQKGLIAENAPRPHPEVFAHMIINTYTKMPIKNLKGTLGLNYCIIAKLFPFTRSLFTPFCKENLPYRAMNDEIAPPKPYCGGRANTNCPKGVVKPEDNL